MESITQVNRQDEVEKGEPYSVSMENYLPHLHLRIWCELILTWENPLLPIGPTLDLLPLSTWGTSGSVTVSKLD